MSVFLSLSALVLLVSTGGAPAGPAVTQSEAVRIAEEYVVTVRVPVKLENVRRTAAYVPDEKVWIVHFADMSPVPPPDSDFMIKVDAQTGGMLGLIGGAGKQRYSGFFKQNP